jgi:hypothetical protein
LAFGAEVDLEDVKAGYATALLRRIATNNLEMKLE